MKRSRSLLPATVDAVATLGALIAAHRRELGWTAAMLAERLGVTPATVGRIEAGSPGTAVGTVLEAAVLCRVPLFNADLELLPLLRRRAELERALLPDRVQTKTVDIDTDF